MPERDGGRKGRLTFVTVWDDPSKNPHETGMATVIGKSSIDLFTEEEVREVLMGEGSPINPDQQPIDELIVDPQINEALLPIFEQAIELRKAGQAEVPA